MANNDSTLLAIASAGPVESHAEVLARLQALGRELDVSDGLFWFNRLYAAATEELLDSARRQRFDDLEFFERLHCQFADLYFTALAAHLSDPGTGPAAWDPLFHARTRPTVLPIQLAIVGANAHINRDLPVALVTTCLELDRQPERESAAHADHLHVNALLEKVFVNVKSWLVTDGLVGLEAALRQADDVAALWSLRRAREAAWVAAEVRWALRPSPVIARHHLETLDRMVGLAGRSLLLPLPQRGRDSIRPQPR